MTEPISCPLCGGPAFVKLWSKWRTIVGCAKCDLRLERSRRYYAVKAWNRRAKEGR